MEKRFQITESNIINLLRNFFSCKTNTLPKQCFCIFAVIDCGDINIDNGSFGAPQGTTAPNTATITCNKGYIIDGETSKEITCTVYGNWSSLSECQGMSTLDVTESLMSSF